MPKSNYCKIVKTDDDYLNNVAVNITHEMFLQKLTFKDLAKKTGLKESTLSMRMRQPGTIRQFEIVEIAKALKISPFRLVSGRLKYEEANV
ncbi:MAG: helix-turn-helix transcriptional regulator [Oscillospiraceae bacterium]|nr:helix-turn-helix transcriptional regulator [Oscillospiraceae bacterium]